MQQGTTFTTKFAKTVMNNVNGAIKNFITIPSGFFSSKNGRTIMEEEKANEKVVFGRTALSPSVLCKVEEKYEFGGIKKKPGRKVEIYAKPKTYIPIVLDYLECKIKRKEHEELELRN